MEDNTNTTTNTNNQTQDNQQTVPSKAFVRTFKSDIKKEMGSGAQGLVDKLVPKGTIENTKQDPASIVPAEESSLQSAIESIDSDENRVTPKSMLHTYKSDVQNIVKRKKLSLVSMAAAEAGQKDGQKYAVVDSTPKAQSSNKGLLILSVALIVLGLVALGGILYTSSARQAGGPAAPHHLSLLFADKTEVVDITGKTPNILKQELTRIRDGAYYSPGSVVELLLIKKTLDQDTGEMLTKLPTSIEVLTKLGASNIDRFKTVLLDQSMIGLYAGDVNSPFIVLKTNLYDYTFETLLNWEQYMVRDLAPLFSPRGEHVDLGIYSADTVFADTVINNKDVRVMRDADGKTLLLYAFANKNTVIITTSVQAFIELTGRLRVAK